MVYCKYYVGVSCIDGSCPRAQDDENAPAEKVQCSECPRYKGCDDCATLEMGGCPAMEIVKLGAKLLRIVIDFYHEQPK